MCGVGIAVRRTTTSCNPTKDRRTAVDDDRCWFSDLRKHKARPYSPHRPRGFPPHQSIRLSVCPRAIARTLGRRHTPCLNRSSSVGELFVTPSRTWQRLVNGQSSPHIVGEAIKHELVTMTVIYRTVYGKLSFGVGLHEPSAVRVRIIVKDDEDSSSNNNRPIQFHHHEVTSQDPKT